MFIVSCVWILISSANLWKTYSHRAPFNIVTGFWAVCLILYIIVLAHLLLSKTRIILHNRQLSIASQYLFHKKTKVYNVDKMESLEVNPVTVTKYPSTDGKLTGEYSVNFLYGDEAASISGYINKTQAEQLLGVILAAKEKIH